MGKPFDEEADEAMRQQVEEQIERESLALFMTGKLYDDGIIDPRDTRTVLGMCLGVIDNDADPRHPRLRRVPDVSVRTIRHRPGPHRQPRRDRPAHHPHVPPARVSHRRRVQRRRRRTRRTSARPTSPCRLPGNSRGRHVPARRPADRTRRSAAARERSIPATGSSRENAAFAAAVADAGLVFDRSARRRRSRRWDRRSRPRR